MALGAKIWWQCLKQTNSLVPTLERKYAPQIYHLDTLYASHGIVQDHPYEIEIRSEP